MSNGVTEEVSCIYPVENTSSYNLNYSPQNNNASRLNQENTLCSDSLDKKQMPRINNLELNRREDTEGGALTDLLDRLNKSQALVSEVPKVSPDSLPLKPNLQKVNSEVMDSPRKRTATWVKAGPHIQLEGNFED